MDFISSIPFTCFILGVYNHIASGSRFVGEVFFMKLLSGFGFPFVFILCPCTFFCFLAYDGLFLSCSYDTLFLNLWPLIAGVLLSWHRGLVNVQDSSDLCYPSFSLFRWTPFFSYTPCCLF